MKNFKIDKKVFQKLIKNHSKYASYYDCNILHRIRFELKDGVLELASTDGNRLLLSQVEVEDAGQNGVGVYNGGMLGAIKFLKNMRYTHGEYFEDSLEITIKDKELNIVDLANSFYYNVPVIDGQFPKYEQLIPKVKDDEYTTIGLNKEFFKDIDVLCVNDRTNIVEFSFKNNSALTPVIATSKMSNIKTKVLLMPIQIR